MKYVSTRGRAPASGFSDVLLAGLAGDGGLFVPETWPTLDRQAIAALAGQPYPEAAFQVIRPFVGGEIADDALRAMCVSAYATFRHPAVVPLTQIAPGEWMLELFHGPTLAFKDVAMQLLARLMDHVLAERNKRVTIIGATSGDTGAAAIEAFRGRDNADVFILFPEGRVSPIQQRQMTTVEADNIHAIAVKGTFDDCQALVKGLFGNERLRQRLGLAGINSINWARILGQIVYYVTAAVALGSPARRVSFTVPTGNFGDIFAGYAAKRMGLPVERLVIATNVNDILARTLDSGRYEVRAVTATTSPSMDIQVSSNFERLLFEAYGRDAAAVEGLMQRLNQARAFDIAAGAAETHRRGFFRRPGRRGRGRRNHARGPCGDRRTARSAHGDRARRQPPLRRSGRADGDAGDRPRGQISRGGRGGDRYPSRGARGARRHPQQARALCDAGQRCPVRRGLHCGSQSCHFSREF